MRVEILYDDFGHIEYAQFQLPTGQKDANATHQITPSNIFNQRVLKLVLALSIPIDSRAYSRARCSLSLSVSVQLHTTPTDRPTDHHHHHHRRCRSSAYSSRQIAATAQFQFNFNCVLVRCVRFELPSSPCALSVRVCAFCVCVPSLVHSNKKS